MLNTLHIKHFTVFQDVALQFSPGLNIIIGDNGTGKTHLLKLGYMFCRAWPDLMSKRLPMNKQRAEAYLDEKLAGLFRLSDLGTLVRRGHKNGATLAADIGGHIPTIPIRLPNEPPSSSLGLDEQMRWEIQIKRSKDAPAKISAGAIPESAAVNAFVPRSIFVPSKEIVSLFQGLIYLFETFPKFPLDETYRDLAVALSLTLERRDPSPLLDEVMQRIQNLLGGELRLENNDLVFIRNDGSHLESQLLAEGHRKLALLIYLVRYRLIEAGNTVFWDEPEANLNPAAIRLLADALFSLAEQGVQVICATHSLFFLRELEILSRKSSLANITNKSPCDEPDKAKSSSLENVPMRFFALEPGSKGVNVSVGDQLSDTAPILTLDEDIAQSDRFLDILE